MKPKYWRLIHPDKTVSIMNYNPNDWEEGYNQAVDEVIKMVDNKLKDCKGLLDDDMIDIFDYKYHLNHIKEKLKEMEK